MSVTKGEKIIIRSESFGIDKSLYDNNYAFSNKIAWTKVTKDPFKNFSRTYIELNGNLNVGDIIQSRYSPTMYKVLKIVKITPTGRLYKIARTDCYPFVQTDFDNLKKGRKLKIKNRIVDNGLFSKEEKRKDNFCKD